MLLDLRRVLVGAAAAAIGLLGHGSGSAQTVRGDGAKVSPFARSALLRRFDGNRDGELDGSERRVVREAFGGIDVPRLPDKVHRYAELTLPAYIERAALAKLDNTPKDNPTTDRGATLGRVLFYDRQLSQNTTVACASCHLQKAGFADPRRVSVGYQGGHTTRNAMGLANLRFTNLERQRPGFFWDERAATLEDQALMPIQDKVEMGMELKELEAKLGKLPYYPPLFQAAFESPKVTRDRIAKSVAQFLRSMVSFSSKYDQAAAKAAKAGNANGDFADFTRQENLGKALFMNGIGGITEFACAMCHVPPTFNMSAAANNGLDRKSADRGLGALGRPSNDPFTPDNDGKFKAPSLRNVELTAPYMHDGRFKTLGEVIDHYSGGIHPHPNLGLAFVEDNRKGATSGLRFSHEQKAALIAFLKTLTDRRFTSDMRFSDPFIRLDEPTFRTLKGHTSRVNHIAFSRDGRRLASASHDHTAKVWDVATGKNVFTSERVRGVAWSVALSPDGKRVASGSHFGLVKVWDLSTGKAVFARTMHQQRVSVAFSPDGKRLASAGEEGSVIVSDTATGKRIRTLKGHTDGIDSVAFSPDGKRLATGSLDRTVKLWDLAAGKAIRTFKGHKWYLSSVAFSPDGKRLASGSHDKTVKVWDVSTGKVAFTLKGHKWWVTSVAFSPDGKWIASGGDEGTVTVWDVKTGKEVTTLDSDSQSVNSVAFSSDGHWLATGNRDHTITLWNARSLARRE